MKASALLREAENQFVTCQLVLAKSDIELDDLISLYAGFSNLSLKLIKEFGKHFFFNGRIWRAWKGIDRMQDAIFWAIMFTYGSFDFNPRKTKRGKPCLWVTRFFLRHGKNHVFFNALNSKFQILNSKFYFK